MPARRARPSCTGAYSINWTFEELGRNQGKTIDCQLFYTHHEGEEQTWDYPGSEPYFEFTGVKVGGWDNDTDLGIKLHPSWETLLEKIALDLAEKNRDKITDALCEDHY